MDSAPPPAPRDPAPLRRLADFATFFCLLFGGIWTLVGALTTVVFLLVGGGPWNDWILDQRGVEAQADARAVMRTSARINGRPVRELTAVFRDLSGNERRVVVSTHTPAVIKAAEAGQPFTVVYDPEDVTRARVAGGTASVFGPFTFLPAIFMVVGLGVLTIGMRRLRWRRRVYRDGMAVSAVVTAVNAMSARMNRRRVHRVAYRFQGPGGSQTGSYTSVAPPSVDSTLWIIYDPADPSLSLPA